MINVLLAKPYNPDMDPTGWFISEKLDGIRAIWTGSQFLTRTGNQIHAPLWMLEKFPKNMMFDGELWIDRGKFQQAVSIVRCASQDKGWVHIKYMLFDNCNKIEVFECRQSQIANFVVRNNLPWLRLVTQQPCSGKKHLEKRMDSVIKDGGEGLMLRKPGSLYEGKRSNTLLKVKRWHDVEVVVTGQVPGKGKHVGRLGALSCKLDNGTAFEVGTGFTDAERESPPNVGERITVRYQELTDDGVPRFPVYVTVRDYE